MGKSKPSPSVQIRAPDFNILPNSKLSPPRLPVKVMLGYKAAFAIPICAFSAMSACSDWRISGRFSSKAEGKPTGGVGGNGSVRISPVSNCKSSTPVNIANWCKLSARSLSSSVSWACEFVTATSAWLTSKALATPPSRRRFVRLSDSTRSSWLNFITAICPSKPRNCR